VPLIEAPTICVPEQCQWSPWGSQPTEPVGDGAIEPGLEEISWSSWLSLSECTENVVVPGVIEEQDATGVVFGPLQSLYDVVGSH
jgi:hypothetical protein